MVEATSICSGARMILPVSFRPSYVALALTVVLCACGTTPPTLVEVNLAVVNDLHGYLQPTEQSYWDPTAPKGMRSIRAGGIETLGGLIDDLRQRDGQLLVIGNGDLIGASPALSAMWADEPTILAVRRRLVASRAPILGRVFPTLLPT